jgi:hypothetical protein
MLAAGVPAAAVAAYGLRVGLIEPEAFGHLCAGGGGPWWCWARGLLIGAVHTGVIGAGAVAFGALASFRRQAGIAAAAGMLGAAGLVLYDAEGGAVGLLLGLLVLARTLASEPLAEHHPAQQ